MTTLTITILTIILIMFFISILRAEIMFAPVLGLMVGALYSFTDFEEDEEVVHTVQILLLIVSINIIWVKPYNG